MCNRAQFTRCAVVSRAKPSNFVPGGKEKKDKVTPEHAKSSAFVTRIQLIIVGSIDPCCSSMTITVRFIPQVVFPDARVIARNYGLCLRKALKNYGTVAVIHFLIIGCKLQGS